MPVDTPAHIIERNRQNAQLSTGSRANEGKAIARENAVKHGLTANLATGASHSRSRHLISHSVLK